MRLIPSILFWSIAACSFLVSSSGWAEEHNVLMRAVRVSEFNADCPAPRDFHLQVNITKTRCQIKSKRAALKHGRSSLSISSQGHDGVDRNFVTRIANGKITLEERGLADAAHSCAFKFEGQI